MKNQRIRAAAFAAVFFIDVYFPKPAEFIAERKENAK